MVLSILCSVHQVEGEIVIITMRRLQLSLSVIGYGHLVLRCAGSLCHRAVSRDLDAPSFWLYNQRKVYFQPIKTSIFRNQRYRYRNYNSIQILHFAYISAVHLTKHCILYCIPHCHAWHTIQSKNQITVDHVSILSNQNIMNLIHFFPCKMEYNKVVGWTWA